jgi:hypothetical protein
MSETGDVRQVARSVIDAVVRQHGNEVFLGDGYNADETLIGGIVTALTAQTSEVERLKTELTAARRELDALRKLKADLYVLNGRLKAAQPAPSGWQQRIAAMEPFRPGIADDYCLFCSVAKRAIARRSGRHDDACLWQNAVDALPPASEVKDAREVTVRLMDSDDDPLLVHLPYQECQIGEPHHGSTCPVWKGGVRKCVY